MVEGGSVPNSASSLQESLPNQNSATGYGFIRPSFSYLNANNNMPQGSSQQSSSAPVQQLDSPGPSASVQPLASGVSVNRTPPFPYNVLHPNAGFSASTNDKANGTQEMGAVVPVPAHTQSTSQPAGTNPSDSAPHSVSNNLTNTAMWMPQVPAYQVPPGMPRTPFIPGPPAMAPAAPSPSNMRIPPSPTIQHQGVAPYPSPSLPAAPPGQWLQPQQINSFSRPLFSPYAAAAIPGPYSMPSHGMPQLSVALPDVQPPGVSAPASAVGVLTSSFASGEQSSSGQGELPPGTDSDKHVGSAETKDESVSTEQVDAWTAHRTETGVVYYYNALTGESTYEKPSGFKGEADKAIAQPSPVSWEKLAGTDWTLVTTNDGKRYYYNSKTQLSSWQIPSEVTELKKKQEADVLKAQFVTASNTNLVTEKGSTPVHLSSPAATTGGRDAIAFRPSNISGTSSALDLIKKKLQDSGIPASTSPGPALSGAGASDLNGSKPTEPISKGSQDENNKDKHNGDISDSSSDSEDEDRGPTKEERILQFKEMLKERGVAPFSKWEKELPKIVFDPRFKAIPSHSARRAIFEHYVRTRAEEERKEKRAAQKAALEGFKQLLEEAKEEIHHSTDYQTFKMKWGDDPRFRALDRKEREVLLNERVLPLKRAAQEKAQAERAAAISNFKSMLQDRGDITSKSRWSKVKDNLRSDPRYKSVKHEDREKIFNEYVADLKASEVETDKIAKAKQDEEDKLKERERALRKRKEREVQEVERVRLKARRKEAVESYQALLVETIKDPQASWTESKTKLEKDPQGRAANPHLDKSDLEKLFREHVKSLYERCIVEFKALLSKVITPEAAARETEEGKTVINSWSTAKQLLKNDPRYNKVPRKERETLWHRHAEDIQHKLKSMNDQETADGKNTSSDPVKQQRTYDRR